MAVDSALGTAMGTIAQAAKLVRPPLPIHQVSVAEIVAVNLGKALFDDQAIRALRCLQLYTTVDVSIETSHEPSVVQFLSVRLDVPRVLYALRICHIEYLAQALVRLKE